MLSVVNETRKAPLYINWPSRDWWRNDLNAESRSLSGTVRVTVGFIPLITCLPIGSSHICVCTYIYMYMYIYFFSCLPRVRANSRCQVSLFPISRARIRQRVAQAKKHGVVVKTMYPCFECTPDGLYGSRQHFRNANVIVTRDLIHSSGWNWRTRRASLCYATWRTKRNVGTFSAMLHFRGKIFIHLWTFTLFIYSRQTYCNFSIFLFSKIEREKKDRWLLFS